MERLFCFALSLIVFAVMAIMVSMVINHLVIQVIP